MTALGVDGIGLGLQSLHRQPVQEGRVGQLAFMIGLEQVAVDVTSSNIGIDGDEQSQPVIRFYLRRGQGAADRIWITVMGRLIEPHGFLCFMVAGHGEGHQLVEVFMSPSRYTSIRRGLMVASLSLWRTTAGVQPKRAAISSGPLPLRQEP